MIEYALAIGALAMVAVLALALIAGKGVDVMSMSTATMPGAHPSDNGPIASGTLVPYANNGTGLTINVQKVFDEGGTARLGNAFGDPNLASVLVDPRVQ